MFPRYHVPHPPPKCKECDGTGKFMFTHSSEDCPKCNGTGIAGNAKLLVGCLIVYGVTFAALALYAIVKTTGG